MFGCRAGCSAFRKLDYGGLVSASTIEQVAIEAGVCIDARVLYAGAGM